MAAEITVTVKFTDRPDTTHTITYELPCDPTPSAKSRIMNRLRHRLDGLAPKTTPEPSPAVKQPSVAHTDELAALREARS